MAHVVRIKSKEQHIDAIRVLNNVAGTWQAVGTSSDPVLLLTDTQFNALVAAGVVPAKDKEVKPRGKELAMGSEPGHAATAQTQWDRAGG